MNYYEHHLGDYLRDTVHLTCLEDGVYRRLIDAYYTREQPLPKDFGACCRLARAVTKQERAAVASILAEYFFATDSGYAHRRCDEEIARFRAKSGKARASAEARWNARQSHSEGNANAYANASPVGMRSHMPTQCEGNALQSPVSSLQSPERERKGGNTNVTEDLKPPGSSRPRSPRAAARTRCPEDFVPDRDFALAELPDLDVEREIAKFRDFGFAKPRSDWPATWRNWIRRAKDGGGYARKAPAQPAKASIANPDGTLNLEAFKASGMLG